MSTITIDLPEGIQKHIEALAAKQGYTVSQFLAAAATEKLEAMTGLSFLQQEMARGKREDFERFLEAVPDAPPEPRDL
jgi:uncharacterized protein (DUF1778 family)